MNIDFIEENFTRILDLHTEAISLYVESCGDGAKIPPAVATAAPSPDDEPKGEFDWYGHAAELKRLNDNE